MNALEFAAKRGGVRLASNLKPTRVEVVSAANISLTGFSESRINGAALPGAPGLFSQLGESYPAQTVKAVVGGAAAFLGPLGPLVGTAGLWLVADVLGGLFATAPSITDRARLVTAQWRQIGVPRQFYLDQVDAHGWIIGGRIAGEVLAAAGAIIGRKGIVNIGSQTGAELWASPSGNWALIVDSRSSTEVATIAKLLQAEGLTVPGWLFKNRFSVDLSSGAIYEDAADLILMDALRGLTLASIEEGLTAWGTMAPEARKMDYGPRGRVPVSAAWDTGGIWGGYAPWSGLAFFTPACNYPERGLDPYYAKLCEVVTSYHHSGTTYSADPVGVNMDALGKAAKATGLRPWRIDRVYELARDDYEQWPYELPRWPPSKSATPGARPMMGNVIPPPSYSHTGSDAVNAWQAITGPSPFTGGPLAPWEPTGPDMREPLRPEPDERVQQRFRRWGPLAPAWRGRGTAAWVSDPLSYSAEEGTNWYPLEEAAPDLAQAIRARGGMPGGAALAMAAAAVLLLAKR